MDWSDVVGRRLALILVAGESDDPPGGILRGVVRAEGSEFILERGEEAPFPLLREWGHRVRLLSEVSAPEVLAIIGDVDCFVTLSVGPLPETASAKDISATGLNWNEFSEGTPASGEP